MKLWGSSVNNSWFAGEFNAFCLFSGRAWCKWASGSKGKIWITSSVISRYLSLRCFFALYRELYFIFTHSKRMSCRGIRGLLGFQVCQAQTVQKGILVPGVHLAHPGPRVLRGEASAWTLTYGLVFENDLTIQFSMWSNSI